jgi:anti-anti-sigma regulatory factor
LSNSTSENRYEIKVGGLDFKWDMGEGLFLFENEDSVLFWISSAMKTFFDTIEEVSGEDAASVVLETTGFRQGLVVGEYFRNLKGVNVTEAAALIPHTYASAGWGKAQILDLNQEAFTVTVRMLDSWEFKINKAQGKEKGGTFLAAHYAGIFTGLFGKNIWFEVKKDQVNGDEYSVFEYSPSSVTVSKNIHQLARKKESEHIRELEILVEQKTKDLQELIKQISSPIIPVLEGIVVVPLIGKYDESRSEDLLVKTLNNLPKYQARFLVLDLTGLDQEMSGYSAEFIRKLGAAASLIGVDTILVGISAELGKNMTESNINLSKFPCFHSLQHGIYYSLAQVGRKII